MVKRPTATQRAVATGDDPASGLSFEPVDKGTPVSVQIATQLIGAIESRQFSLGSRLPSENVLTQQFGVSRTSIREALAILQFAGYVEARRGSGTTVASTVPTGTAQLHHLGLRRPKDILDLFESRLAVEPEAVRQAATEPLPTPLRKLHKLLEGMQLAVGRPQLHAHSDIGIHVALVRTCPNRFLAQSAEALIGKTEGRLWRTIRDQAWDDGELPRSWLGHHEAIVTAVTNRDAEAAVAGIEAHLLSVIDHVARSVVLSPTDCQRVEALAQRFLTGNGRLRRLRPTARRGSLASDRAVVVR